MISVDITEIEQLTDLLIKAASDTDESLSLLRKVSFEMQNDIELQTYIQSAIANESVSLAIDSLNRGSDTLQSLKNVLMSVADGYIENEKKNINSVNRMASYLENLHIGLDAALAATQIPVSVQTDDVVSHTKVQQLVADSAESLSVTNIAAVTKTVQKEYDVQSVKTFEPKE